MFDVVWACVMRLGKGLQVIGRLGEEKSIDRSPPASGENSGNKNHVCVFLCG